MKLRPLIFLTILALGTLPLLILVSINLNDHIQRHETSGRADLTAQAHLNSIALQSKIDRVRDDLQKLADLSAMGFFATSQENRIAAPANTTPLNTFISKWFIEYWQAEEIRFKDASGNTSLIVSPASPQQPVQEERAFNTSHPTPKAALASRAALPDFSMTVVPADPNDRESPPASILFSLKVPLPNTSEGAGVLMMQVKTAAFLAENGSLLYSPDSQTAWQMNTSPPAQKSYAGISSLVSGNTPVLLEQKNRQVIAWLPLSVARNSPPILWTGRPIDTGDAARWKRSLIINITAVIMVTMLVVFLIAHFIAAKIDRIKQEMITGLDAVLNKETAVSFCWEGPRELELLAEDLSALVQRYIETRSASRNAETELRESENKFRKLTSSAQDGIIMMDHQGNVAYWNKAAERIFGYHENEAMGQPTHTLLDLRRLPQDNDRPLPRLTHHEGAPSKADIIELMARRSDGSDIPVELSLAATHIKDQWHAIWIIRDIADRKKAEKEASLRQQQLIQADKMRSLGLLVSGVAHEINNPNSIAMLNTPMLARAWASVSPLLEKHYEQNGDFLVAGLDYSEMRQQIPRLFSELEESTRRIKNIVKDLKDYARQDSSDLTEPVAMHEIIATALRLTQNQLNKATNAFKTLIEPVPQVTGNRQRLEQVVINLIQNACQALTSKHQAIVVRLTADANKQSVILTVQDEGEGMEPDVLQQITDPFYTTRRAMGGTGLGLSVSAGIIREHGGTLAFESEPARGTKATITLPAACS